MLRVSLLQFYSPFQYVALMLLKDMSPIWIGSSLEQSELGLGHCKKQLIDNNQRMGLGIG